MRLVSVIILTIFSMCCASCSQLTASKDALTNSDTGAIGSSSGNYKIIGNEHNLPKNSFLIIAADIAKSTPASSDGLIVEGKNESYELLWQGDNNWVLYAKLKTDGKMIVLANKGIKSDTSFHHFTIEIFPNQTGDDIRASFDNSIVIENSGYTLNIQSPISVAVFTDSNFGRSRNYKVSISKDL